LIRESVAASTWLAYERHSRLYLLPALGDRRLDALVPEDIDKLHAYAARRVLGNTSGQIHRTLAITLNAARKRGYRVSDALQAVGRPKGKKREIVPLTWEEVEQLLSAA